MQLFFKEESNEPELRTPSSPKTQDSNNKIVKQGDTGITDLHGAGVDGSANQLLTDDGDGTVTSEANLTFDGSDLTVT